MASKEEQFQNYKKAERKALEILREMSAATPNAVDIELALLVAVFELHKDSISAETTAGIIQEHLKALLVHYGKPQG